MMQGEAVALIGQNGAGKSTILKMVTGTVRPTEGTISVNGRISAILELGLGFNAEFTGRQNIYQAGGLMGFSQQELTEMMPAIEDFAEIGEFFDQPIRVYSSGMMARLAFALATAKRARTSLSSTRYFRSATAISSTKVSIVSGSSRRKAHLFSS